jgi:hypothetical protein
MSKLKDLAGTSKVPVEEIARVCHEANRAYCRSLGDITQLNWTMAPGWQRESAINGVKFNIANPDAPASASHDNWLKEKLENGWTYGPVKDADAKTHPCCVSYEELPVEQRRKDALFKAIVAALTAE